MQYKINDIPSDLPCYVANPSLWAVFVEQYYLQEGHEPSYSWTESEAQQWMDTEYTETSYPVRVPPNFSYFRM